MELFDTHAHLDDEAFAGDLEAVLDRARAAGVAGVVTVGTDIASSCRACAIAAAHGDVQAAVGLGPHEAGAPTTGWLEGLRTLARNEKVAAIGEVGLDFHRARETAETQRAAFCAQVELANELGLAVLAHSRGAERETFEILRDAGARGIMHCFGGDAALAPACAEAGLFVSFAGNVTFPKAMDLRAAAGATPDARLLIETDAPCLAPQAVRGARCESAHLVHTARCLADVRGVSAEDVGRITTHNAHALLGLGREAGEKYVYAIRDALYVNLTNRCSNACTFCPRTKGRYVVKGHDLALTREPEAREVVAAIEKSIDTAGGRPREIVFCGFGEPTLRLEVLEEVARAARGMGLAVRVNTNGQAAQIHGRDVLPELGELVDAFSVSLNAATATDYAHLCRPETGEAAFGAVRAFVRRARELGFDVSVTAVDVPGLDRTGLQRLADSLGVPLRIRGWNVVG